MEEYGVIMEKLDKLQRATMEIRAQLAVRKTQNKRF